MDYDFEEVENMTNQLKEHYSKIFGSFKKDFNQLNNVSVSCWEDHEYPDQVVLSTLGMSSKEQNIPTGQKCISKHPRTELISYVNPKWIKAMVTLLSNLTEYPFKTNSFIFWWHNLPIGVPIIPSSKLDAVFFSIPPLKADEVTLCIDQQRIDLLWVIPITEKELLFCKKNGSDAFEDLMKEKEMDFSNLLRSSIC